MMIQGPSNATLAHALTPQPDVVTAGFVLIVPSRLLQSSKVRATSRLASLADKPGTGPRTFCTKPRWPRKDFVSAVDHGIAGRAFAAPLHGCILA